MCQNIMQCQHFPALQLYSDGYVLKLFLQIVLTLIFLIHVSTIFIIVMDLSQNYKQCQHYIVSRTYLNYSASTFPTLTALWVVSLSLRIKLTLVKREKKLFEVHDVLFMDEKFFATKPPEGPAGVEKYFLTESNCKRT